MFHTHSIPKEFKISDKTPNGYIAVAPMMGYTNRHFRYFIRAMTKYTILYTEMIPCEALLHSNPERFLKYHPEEHPLILQLGGSDPVKLAECAHIAQQYGYDAVNLNAGCPSDRVQKGRFGACLMKEPRLVAECLFAMKERVSIPVTLKIRTGVDELDSYADLTHFVSTVVKYCDELIVHARKAWLKGLSPKENRTIPPLQPETVYRLKKDFPEQIIAINGEIRTLEDIQIALEKVDGVMIGRYACDNPYFFSEVDEVFGKHSADLDYPHPPYGHPLPGGEGKLCKNDYANLPHPPYGHPLPEGEGKISRIKIIEKMLPYLQIELERGTHFRQIVCHWLNLFHRTPHARHWRRYLSDYMANRQVIRPEEAVQIIHSALENVRQNT